MNYKKGKQNSGRSEVITPQQKSALFAELDRAGAKARAAKDAA